MEEVPVITSIKQRIEFLLFDRYGATLDANGKVLNTYYPVIVEQLINDGYSIEQAKEFFYPTVKQMVTLLAHRGIDIEAEEQTVYHADVSGTLPINLWSVDVSNCVKFFGLIDVPADSKTPRDRLNYLYNAFFLEAANVFVRKNKDYNSDDDPLSGFRDFGVFGIMVRLGDKFARIRNIFNRGGVRLVLDETIKDTLLDIVNYCFLAYAVMTDEETNFIKGGNNVHSKHESEE